MDCVTQCRISDALFGELVPQQSDPYDHTEENCFTQWMLTMTLEFSKDDFGSLGWLALLR